MTPPLLGTPVLRVEDHHLLVGDTTFVANLDLPGVLHAHFVTSIDAHARLLAVDVEEARRAPGVVDVVTAAEVTSLGPVPGSPPGYPPGTDRPLLVTDRIRFVGEPLVAIVAESAAAAADAAELVRVETEPLPAVVELDAALRGEVLLFDHLATNVMVTDAGGREEPPDFERCEVVVELEMVNQRLAPCPIETRVAASSTTPPARAPTRSSMAWPSSTAWTAARSG